MSFWIASRKPPGGHWWYSIDVPPIVALVLIAIALYFSRSIVMNFGWTGAGVCLLASAGLFELARRVTRFRGMYSAGGILFGALGGLSLIILVFVTWSVLRG